MIPRFACDLTNVFAPVPPLVTAIGVPAVTVPENDALVPLSAPENDALVPLRGPVSVPPERGRPPRFANAAAAVVAPVPPCLVLSAVVKPESEVMSELAPLCAGVKPSAAWY